MSSDRKPARETCHRGCRRLTLMFAISLLAITGEANAVPKGAEKQYKSALKLENEGHLEEALAAFRLLEKTSDFDVRLHIGACLRKLGRFKEARAAYESIRDDPKADQPTRDTAVSDLTDLKTRIPTVKVSVTAASGDLMVLLDGAVIETPTTAELDAGEHLIVARRIDVPVYEQRIFATESATLTVVVDAPIPKSSPVAPAPRPTPERTPETIRTRWRPVVGYSLIGIGAVAALGGGAFAARTNSLRRESEDLAAAGDVGAHERADDARASQTAARILLGAGVVTVIAGVVVLVTAPKDQTIKTVSLRLGVGYVGLGGEW